VRFKDERVSSHKSNHWIYVGGDIENINWSKIGMTENGLDTRHRSSQNPSYFIYAAFNIVRGNVKKIEADLLDYLEDDCVLKRIDHISTGSASECFRLNPDDMSNIVEGFIEDEYGSSVNYENHTHGGMSRFQCDDNLRRMIQGGGGADAVRFHGLKKGDYFTGNQEIHEMGLGGSLYLDLASCNILDRDDEEGDDD